MNTIIDKVLISNGYSVKKYYFVLNLTVLFLLYSFFSFIVFALDKSPTEYYFYIIMIISLQFQMGVFTLPISYLSPHYLRILRFHNVSIVDIFLYYIANAFSIINSLFIISIYIVFSFGIGYLANTPFIEILSIQIIGIVFGFTILSLTLLSVFKRNKVLKIFFFFYYIFVVTLIPTIIDFSNIYYVLILTLVYATLVFIITRKLMNRMDVIDLWCLNFLCKKKRQTYSLF